MDDGGKEEELLEHKERDVEATGTYYVDDDGDPVMTVESFKLLPSTGGADSGDEDDADSP